jgi:hypothetical protein
MYDISKSSIVGFINIIFQVQSPDVVRVLKLVRQIIGGKNKSEAIKLEIMQLQGEVMQVSPTPLDFQT